MHSYCTLERVSAQCVRKSNQQQRIYAMTMDENQTDHQTQPEQVLPDNLLKHNKNTISLGI